MSQVRPLHAHSFACSFVHVTYRVLCMDHHSLGCETVLCVGEADLQLSVDARKAGTFAVLARDSDFSLMSGIQYIPYDSVDIVCIII